MRRIQELIFTGKAYAGEKLKKPITRRKGNRGVDEHPLNKNKEKRREIGKRERGTEKTSD